MSVLMCACVLSCSAHRDCVCMNMCARVLVYERVCPTAHNNSVCVHVHVCVCVCKCACL